MKKNKNSYISLFQAIIWHNINILSMPQSKLKKW